jgi:hypothetical protein
MAQNDWALVSACDLVQRLRSQEANPSPAQTKRQAIHQYSIVLYEACRQAKNSERRERAYTELHRYLYRAAYNRRRELADDATQRALLLVYEQIDRCQSPGTFLKFAIWKLLQAIKDEDRARGKELSLEDVDGI